MHGRFMSGLAITGSVLKIALPERLRCREQSEDGATSQR